MITRAKFQNFKALRDVEITFDSRLTVIVGPNGSGKTSVLQGIHALGQLAVVSGSDPDVSLARLTEFTSVGTDEGDFGVTIEGSRPKLGSYRIEVNQHEPHRVLGILLTTELPPGREWDVTSHYHDGQWGVNVRHDELRPEDAKRFDHTAFIRFSAGQLAAPTLIRSMPPRIGKDGLGLAATLRHIRDKHEPRFHAIVEAFRKVIPQVKRVRFDEELVGGTDAYGASLLIDYQGVEGVKASHVSSGTLFALGLLTVALGPDSANVILLDDLDHGLHPKAQMELIAVFRNLIEQNSELQIIATAHSPYILHRLEWNEIRVTELREDGSALCAKLEDHPDVERWKESMTPGEFWSHIGDEWVKKLGKPRTPQPQPEPVAS
jgi:predicted ATPase